MTRFLETFGAALAVVIVYSVALRCGVDLETVARGVLRALLRH